MATSGLFVAQAVAAPWYVTWLFSAQWHDAGWLVSVLCLSSVSAILLDTRGFFYRAQNQVGEEAKIMLFAVLSSAGCILWVNPQTAMALAITTTSASLLWLMSIIPFLVQILLFNKKIQPIEVRYE